METLELNEVVAAKKVELVRLLDQEKSWLQRHRIYNYKPLQHQVKFHASRKHIRLAVGSNRSGKTTAGVLEDIAAALGFYPWLLPAHLKRMSIEDLLAEPYLIPAECRTAIKTPCKILIIEDDWDVADGILVTGNAERAGKLTHYLPPGALDGKPEKNSLGYYYQWHLKNGSMIRIDTEKSFVNNPQSFEGDVWDVVHYDEPKKRDLRVALKRGLVDRNGYEIFTLTPLAEPWVKDELYDKASIDPEIEAFFFDTKDNPHVSPEGWQAFVSSLDEIEKDARVHGKWTHLRGLVYPEFKCRSAKDNGNLSDPIKHGWVAKNGSVYVAIDPHSRQPMTAMLLIKDAKGRLIVWDEIFVKTLISDFCDLIKSKLTYKDENGTNRTLPVVRYIIDPIAFQEDPVDGGSWALEFHNQGIPVEEAPKRREQGICDVRAAFRDLKLFVCSNCARTIHELQHYVYDEWRNTRSRNEKEKPVDRDDHLCECLYRLLLIDPVYVSAEDANRLISPKKGWCP